MKNKRKEIKDINYRNYFMVIAVLAFFAAALNIMYNISTVFANNYASVVYPYWVRSVGVIFSELPFNGIEVITMLLLAWFLFSAIRLTVYYIKYRKKQLFFFTYRLKKSLLNLTCVILVLALLFSLNYGFNCHRISFSASSHIIPKEYSDEELTAACKTLIEQANTLTDNNTFDYSKLNFTLTASDSMHALITRYPFMPDYYPQAKAVYISGILDSLNIKGFYSPFTIEACYNDKLPDCEKIFTICHELAHVSGYMNETEADFIAFLACSASSSPEFQYSGLLHAISSVLADAHERLDSDTYEELYSSINESSLLDLQKISSSSMTDLLLAYLK